MVTSSDGSIQPPPRTTCCVDDPRKSTRHEWSPSVYNQGAAAGFPLVLLWTVFSRVCIATSAAPATHVKRGGPRNGVTDTLHTMSKFYEQVFRLAAATWTSTTACCATLGPVATRTARANQRLLVCRGKYDNIVAKNGNTSRHTFEGSPERIAILRMNNLSLALNLQSPRRKALLLSPLRSVFVIEHLQKHHLVLSPLIRVSLKPTRLRLAHRPWIRETTLGWALETEQHDWISSSVPSLSGGPRFSLDLSQLLRNLHLSIHHVVPNHATSRHLKKNQRNQHSQLQEETRCVKETTNNKSEQYTLSTRRFPAPIFHGRRCSRVVQDGAKLGESKSRNSCKKGVSKAGVMNE
ncbi:uncharacterized protein CLUP02_18078 [Colletotrichum lupini]|uniref:Uncharacterized protein n=1 Tax=Colletotrichum lupini TaxID=145971 RepID=A0A9Q8WBI6_9PEZI|nr:uncharacterized protein CLUP02_18078 [Colletotrichum lupini]UQC76565.1 hypothetical protein CLUP02_18078 [Colletotrichum lupini]